MLKSVHEMAAVAKDLITGKYPKFVYWETFSEREIPCFCFHDAVIKDIEPVLAYLKDNNYHTLSLKQFGEAVKGNVSLKGRKSVFLTFDDGVGSIWSVLYPLLKKYGVRATVFIIPGRINFRKEYLPNLDDVWSGKAEFEEVIKRDVSGEPFSTWEEIVTMHNSGAMDFDSHTLDHSLVFSSPKIVDFVNPIALEKYHSFEFPRVRYGQNHVETIDQLGAPLFETQSRMSCVPRYKDPKSLREGCISFVKENGGEGFFDEVDWREKLQAFVQKHPEFRPTEAEFESEAEVREAIRFQIRRAKEMIEQILPNKRSTHLCYPWGVACQLATEIAKEEGYEFSYWTHPTRFRRRVFVGQDPYHIDRMGPDFFYCLPGKGRRSVFQVISKKLRRRAAEGSPYLSH